MSFLDKFKKQAGQVVDKHGDKINQGLDKAAHTIDERTGRKHSGKITKGVTKAKEGLDKLDPKDGGSSGSTGGSSTS